MSSYPLSYFREYLSTAEALRVIRRDSELARHDLRTGSNSIRQLPAHLRERTISARDQSAQPAQSPGARDRTSHHDTRPDTHG
jgi:hypothetical protein